MKLKKVWLHDFFLYFRFLYRFSYVALENQLQFCVEHLIMNHSKQVLSPQVIFVSDPKVINPIRFFSPIFDL